MLQIYVDNEPDLWDMDYKMEVAGDSFDETFVLTGNRNFKGCEEATWWKQAKELISDLEDYTFPGQCFEYYSELSRSQRKAILKTYDKCRYTDDLDFVCDVLNILYPDKGYKSYTIRGYSQGDWQNVVCSKEDAKIIDILEAFYFGSVAELHIVGNDEDCWGYITDAELWKAEQEGKMHKVLLSIFGYEADTECQIFVSDGYVRTKKWKEV